MGCSLDDKKDEKITKSFIKIVKESNCKTKNRADESRKVFNTTKQSWLEGNHAEIYSAQNWRKSVVLKKIIRLLKSKIYKYVTATSKKKKKTFL